MFTLLLHVDDDIYIIIITWRSSFQSDPLLYGPSSGGKQELNSKISCVWRKIENVMNVCSDPQNYQQQLHANSSPHHHHLSVQMLHQWTLFLVVFNYDQLQVFNEKTLLFVLASWLIISSEWSFSVFSVCIAASGDSLGQASVSSFIIYCSRRPVKNWMTITILAWCKNSH